MLAKVLYINLIFVNESFIDHLYSKLRTNVSNKLKELYVVGFSTKLINYIIEKVKIYILKQLIKFNGDFFFYLKGGSKV